jgi:hypothetical protein
MPEEPSLTHRLQDRTRKPALALGGVGVLTNRRLQGACSRDQRLVDRSTAGRSSEVGWRSGRFAV